MLTGKNPLSPGRLPPDARRKTTSFARAAGSFVPKLTAKVFEKYGFHSAEIMTDWARIAGVDVAQWSEPERIRWPRETATGLDGDTERRKGAILVLRVEPARALEIEYKSAEIIDRINRYFGYRAIETLKVLQAPLTRQAAVEPLPKPAVTVTAAAPPPNLDQVGEDGLKAALTKLWSSIAAERAARRGQKSGGR